MDEMNDLKLRVAALERALAAALTHSPDAAETACKALMTRLDEIAKSEPPPREPGFQRAVEMGYRDPRHEAEKASLTRLLGLLSQQ